VAGGGAARWDGMGERCSLGPACAGEKWGDNNIEGRKGEKLRVRVRDSGFVVKAMKQHERGDRRLLTLRLSLCLLGTVQHHSVRVLPGDKLNLGEDGMSLTKCSRRIIVTKHDGQYVR